MDNLDIGFVGEAKEYTPEQKKALRGTRPKKASNAPIKGKDIVVHHVRFGDADDLPQQMVNMIERSSIMPGLSEFWEGVLFGDGIKVYQKVEENGKVKVKEFYNEEVEEWLENTHAEEAVMDTIPDFWGTGNAYMQVILNKGVNKVTLFKHQEVTECRISAFDEDGLSKFVIVDPLFSQNITTDTLSVGEEIPAIPAKNVANILTNKEQALKDKRGMFHIKRKKLGKRYYGLPVWWSEETLKALDISFEMFEFKKGNLSNSMNAKFHIKVWKDFFKDKFGTQLDEEELKKKKREFVKSFHDNLTKPENAGKALWSEFMYDPIKGEPRSGVIIEKIDNDIKDDAYSNAINQITAVLAMATNTNPGLADLIVAGKLGGDTGSAVRESYNVTGKTKTKIARKQLLKPLNWALKFSFPELKNIFIDFASFELTTTDQNKSGVKESNPTNQSDATITE